MQPFFSQAIMKLLQDNGFDYYVPIEVISVPLICSLQDLKLNIATSSKETHLHRSSCRKAQIPYRTFFSHPSSSTESVYTFLYSHPSSSTKAKNLIRPNCRTFTRETGLPSHLTLYALLIQSLAS